MHDVIGTARAAARPDAPAVLLLTDVDALLPATDPPPLATLVLDALRTAVATPHLALVATSSSPESVDPRLRAPDLADRELGLPLPDLRARTELLRRLLVDVPTAEGIDLKAVAERTPGFVAADLVAVRREAAVAAALRHGARPAARVVLRGHRHRRGARPGHPAGPPRRGRRGAAHLDVVVGEPADRRDHPRPGR